MALGKPTIMLERLIMLGITALILVPIWWVERFVNQDGSGHLGSAYAMLEILRGNAFFTDLYSFNSLFIPNASGHWLMVGSLMFLSPFIVTKVMMSITFLAVAWSTVFLHRVTTSGGSAITAFLIGCVVSLNWLWLVGTYNYMLGLSGFIFGVAVYYRWRDGMTLFRSLILALILVIVFASHLISYLILVGSIVTIALFVATDKRFLAWLWTALAIVVSIPMLIIFKLTSAGSEPFEPAWRSLSSGAGVVEWIVQLTAADPFILLSRRTLPFTAIDSPYMFLAAPIVWIAISFVFLALAKLRERKSEAIEPHTTLPFLILFIGSMLATLIAPDDFGLTNGSLLRERILLAGLIFAVPLVGFRKRNSLGHVATACLAYVVIFQGLALWEYSLYSNYRSFGLTDSSAAVQENSTVASVVFIDGNSRFHSFPTTQMINYFGVGRNIEVLDNYEFGHYLFPMVTKNIEMRQRRFDLITSNVLQTNVSEDEFAAKLSKLDSALSGFDGTIDILMLVGENEKAEKMLGRLFEPEPIFESGKIRLFRRRN